MKKPAKAKIIFKLTPHARLRAVLTATICGAFSNAYALPAGEQVQAGSLSFARDAQTLNINQATQKAIVNWQSFGIAANESVKLTQPVNGAALFRIVGNDPSLIYGSLSATGSLFLSNPNGVLFSAGSHVDVGSLVATTMRLNDADFLNGKFNFYSDPNDLANSSVVNQGVIRTSDGGFIVLLGNIVENAGTLIAENGSAVLASAQSAMLDMYGDGLVRVKLSGDALNAAIKNTGNITANGGAIQLGASARTAAINIDGVVQANTLVNRNGVIHLESGATGTTLVNGKVTAQGTAAGSTGGNVQITGERVGLLAAADVNVSGAAAGGTILIGGDYHGDNSAVQNASQTYVAEGAQINADATESGDGGKVVVWADDATRYYGNISAKGGAQSGNGGFVETSGKNYLDFNGFADTSASYGVTGTLLLDPTNITISAGANTIESPAVGVFQEATTATSVLNTTTLQTALASNSVVVTTASPAVSAGTITVSAPVTWASGNSLTLTANSTIAINAAITTGTAASSLILNATGNVTQGAAGIIGGAGGLTKNGAGTATLSRANTYTGATNVNAGTLTISNANALGGAGTGTTVVAGATLNINNVAIGAEAVVLNGTLRGTGVGASLSGTVALNAAGTVINAATATDALTLSGAVTGVNALTKTGNGTLTLGGANTYTGVTNINAGTLVAANSAALGTATLGTIVANNAALALRGGITIGAEALSITGTGVGTNGALRNVSGNNTFGGTVALTGNSEIQSDAGTLTLNAANSITGTNRTLAIDGAGNTAINGTITTGTGGLTKNNTGLLTLSGTNTYTGATNINAGTLRLGATSVIANTSAVTVAGGAIFDLNGMGERIGSLAGSGSVTLGGSSLFVGTNATNTTFSGVISGSGMLFKEGAGALTLSGVNTYTGATEISGGTLVASNNSALGGSSAGTTVFGGTLNISNATVSDAVTLNGGTLTGSGAAGITGAVTTVTGSTISTTSGASVLTLSGVATAPGNLLISGAGDVVATNALNDFSTVRINGAKNVSLRDANAITLGNGASSLTGNLTVQAAGNVTVANNVTSTGGDITLAGNNFINTAGATALTAGAGKRWLVYANTHTGNTFGGLNSGNQAVWNTAYPAVVSQTGKRYVFANNPGTLTVTSTNQSKTYGQDGAPIVANAYNVTGTFVNAATFGNVFTQDTIANTVTGTATSTGSPVTANAGTYAIDITPITATTGYTLAKSNAGNLTVNKVALTVTANPSQNKVFGSADPLFTYVVGGLGLVNGDTLTGALSRIAGEAVGNYAINQGTLAASTNYQLTYFGNNFSILIPQSGNNANNPRNAVGIVDANSAASVVNQLAVLNVGATSAGEGSTGGEVCEEDPAQLGKDKDSALLLNFGMNLPKGLNKTCDKS